MKPRMREYVKQICKMDQRLLCILDIKRIVSLDKN